MRDKKPLPVRTHPEAGGKIEDIIPIVNGNAEERAALRGAMAAGRRADARRQARQRRRQQRRTLRDIGLITAGAGAVFVGIAIVGMCPWWIGVAGILVAQAMLYVARRL